MYVTFYYSPNYHGVIVGQYAGNQCLVVALLVEVGIIFSGKWRRILSYCKKSCIIELIDSFNVFIIGRESFEWNSKKVIGMKKLM